MRENRSKIAQIIEEAESSGLVWLIVLVIIAVLISRVDNGKGGCTIKIENAPTTQSTS